MTIIDKTLDLLPKKLSRKVVDVMAESYFQLKRKHLLGFYSRFISSGDLVFDVGAHKGHLTSIFLDLGAKVVCIDPNPYCVKILKNKFKRNKNAIIVEKGLGEKKGKLSFSICEKRPGISTFSKKWKKGRFSKQKWEKEIEVEVTTLNSLIKEFGVPKYCKIDVEGFELQVIKGLGKKIPFISFEFTKEMLNETELCLDHIETLGNSSFNVAIYTNVRLDSKYWINSEKLMNRLRSMTKEDLHGDIYAHIQ